MIITPPFRSKKVIQPIRQYSGILKLGGMPYLGGRDRRSEQWNMNIRKTVIRIICTYLTFYLFISTSNTVRVFYNTEYFVA